MSFSRRLLARVSLFSILFWLPLQSAQAACLVPAGDLNGSGITDVVDAQCAILTALASLSDASPPTCLAVDLPTADLNCNAAFDVTDVLLVLVLALGESLDASLDADGDQCADTCQAVDICGDALCAEQEDCANCPQDCACNPNDPCLPSSCMASPSGGFQCVTEPVNCDDGQICTDDSCVDGECEHTPNQASCNDGIVCTANDRCQPNGQCHGDITSFCDDALPPSPLYLPDPGAVLTADGGFETPAVADGTPLDAVSTAANTWKLWGPDAQPPLLIGRSGEAYQGGQFLRFTPDAENQAVRGVRQDLATVFNVGSPLMASVRLRATGPTPASGEIRLSARTTGGEIVAEHAIEFSELESTWRQHTLWPIEPQSAHDAQPIRLVIETDPMGADPSFFIDLDEARLQLIADQASAWAPNHSFESLNAGFDDGSTAKNALMHWVLSSTNSSHMFVGFNGGSHGPRYLNIEGSDSGALWSTALLPDLAGDYLSEEFRYSLSMDARYRGAPPTNNAQIWMHLFPATGNPGDGSGNLLPRARIKFWKLQDEFKTFYLAGDTPNTLVPANGDIPQWNIGDEFMIQLGPNLPDNPESQIHIDNVRLDRASPIEALASDTSVFIDTTRPVPTRFQTGLQGDARKGSKSRYHFFVPPGISILAAGNDLQVANPDLGKTAGNLMDVYETTQGDKPEFWIEGERYLLWTLDPVHTHPKSEFVGPIYFDTSLPAGTLTRIYYQTSWDKDTTPTTGTPWPAGLSPLRRVDLEVKDFPMLEEPKHFVSSISWIKASEQISWPGYLDNLRSFGFNAVGGHQLYDGYELQGQAVSPIVAEFLDTARAQGYEMFLNASPYNVCTQSACTIVDVEGVPTTLSNTPCPAYGLVGESDDEDMLIYKKERDALATWLAALTPEFIQLDTEKFETGALIALGEHPEHDGCQRCDAYLEAYQEIVPGATMGEALIQMTIDRTADLRQATLDAGAQSLPGMGYYHTRPGAWVYQKVFDLEPMVAADVVQMGIQPFYNTPKQNGDNFRDYQVDAIAAGIDLVPINRPSLLTKRSSPQRTYDNTLELLGSGARAMIWWTNDYLVGADLYYFGKAMESILPVEHLLTTSAPLTGVSGELVGASALPSQFYAVKATATSSGPHYFILVSSYGLATTAGEDPFWVGDVNVTLPSAVTGRIRRISDGAVVGTNTANDNVVTFHFEPGAKGARTALFHLCNTDVGPCDTDGDGLSDEDEYLLYGTDVFAQDSDEDGYPDAEEIESGWDPSDPESP